MQTDPGAGRYVLCPDRTVLLCRCAEELILLGREEDWYSEGRTAFECSWCGSTNTLADRRADEGRNLIAYPDVGGSFHEEQPNIRDLIRSLRASGH